MPIDTESPSNAESAAAAHRWVPSQKRAQRTLEKKMWGRVFDDGLFDLYLGVLFANVAAFMLAGAVEQSPPTAIYVVVLLATYQVYVAAKRRITVPRLGHFKPAAKHRRRFGVVGAISVSVSVLMVVATMLAATGVFSDGIPLVVILFGVLAVKLVVLFSAAAYYLGVLRFYVYAALGAAGYAGAELAVASADIDRGWDIVAMFGAPALAMIPTGIILLRRFIRVYSVREADQGA